MKHRDLLIILKDNGFVWTRTNKHHIYAKGALSVAIPLKKDHSKGLIRRIFQQMQLDKEQVKRYMNER